MKKLLLTLLFQYYTKDFLQILNVLFLVKTKMGLEHKKI